MMGDILYSIFACLICMLTLFVIISGVIYWLPELIDKIREIKISWDDLKEEWSSNDR